MRRHKTKQLVAILAILVLFPCPSPAGDFEDIEVPLPSGASMTMIAIRVPEEGKEGLGIGSFQELWIAKNPVTWNDVFFWSYGVTLSELLDHARLGATLPDGFDRTRPPRFPESYRTWASAHPKMPELPIFALTPFASA